MNDLISMMKDESERGLMPEVPACTNANDLGAIMLAGARVMADCVEKELEPNDGNVMGALIGVYCSLDKFFDYIILTPEARREAAEWRLKQEKHSSSLV